MLSSIFVLTLLNVLAVVSFELSINDYWKMLIFVTSLQLRLEMMWLGTVKRKDCR